MERVAPVLHFLPRWFKGVLRLKKMKNNIDKISISISNHIYSLSFEIDSKSDSEIFEKTFEAMEPKINETLKKLINSNKTVTVENTVKQSKPVFIKCGPDFSDLEIFLNYKNLIVVRTIDENGIKQALLDRGKSDQLIEAIKKLYPYTK